MSMAAWMAVSGGAGLAVGAAVMWLLWVRAARRGPVAMMRCPYCHQTARMEAAIVASPKSRPACGDVSVCWSCRGVGVVVVGVGGRLRLREATDEEMAMFAQDPRLKALLGAISESYTAAEVRRLLKRGERP